MKLRKQIKNFLKVIEDILDIIKILGLVFTFAFISGSGEKK